MTGLEGAGAIERERRMWAQACCDRLNGKALAAWRFYESGYRVDDLTEAVTWLAHLVRVREAFLSFNHDRSEPVDVGARLTWAEPWCRVSASCQSRFSVNECRTAELLRYRDGTEPGPISFFVLEHL